MAQRLATEYVHASLKLTLAQLMQLIDMFARTRTEIRAKVMDSGSQLINLNVDDNQMCLEFQYDGGFYYSSGSYRFVNAEWTNVMRQAIRLFKGDATVHRIYEGFTMIYRYERGHVTKIIESSVRSNKVIYEFKDTLGGLEQMFNLRAVEDEIAVLQRQINELLDRRNLEQNRAEAERIDEQLKQLAHKLFILEA